MFKFLFCFMCVICTIESKQIYRLQDSIKPIHYNVTLKPSFENDSFHGWVTVNMKVLTDQSTITMHCASLEITEVFLNAELANFSLNDELQTISIFPKGEKRLIKKGEHDVHIVYRGALSNEEKKGLRKATYEQNREHGYLLVSDFEPNGARYVFPCFDEPSFKATFKVHLISLNSSFVGLSNMEATNIFFDEVTDSTHYEFATSVVMSTYLVCFIFTDLPYEEKISTINGRPIKIRAYSKERNHSVALDISARALEFYTNYTNIDYPINKLDLIEYERRIAGTENWGIITVVQGVLSPSLHKYHESQVNHVLSHELGHFWFGNLVTNKWWDSLWIQEGLVTFLTNKAQTITSRYNYDSFSAENYYITDSPSESLLNQSDVHEITTEEELSDIFSDVTYLKGAGIFQMIEDVINPDSFKLALRKYLLKFGYKTASTSDLIAIFEAINPQINWKDFIEQYVSQTSYPLINIRRDNGSYILSQSAWSMKNNAGKYKGNRWTIPLSYCTDKNKTQTLIWFDKDMDVLRIPILDSHVIILNTNHKGLYRYNYDDDLWNSVIKNIATFDEDAQKAIMREADLMYRSEHTNCSIVIRLLDKIKPESESWVNFISDVVYLEDYDSRAAEIFAYYMQEYERKRNGQKLFPGFFYKPDRPLKDPSTLKTCIKWIKKGLLDIINNEGTKKKGESK